MINVGKREVVANRYLSAMGNSVSVLSYFQAEEGCGNYSASIFNAILSS